MGAVAEGGRRELCHMAFVIPSLSTLFVNSSNGVAQVPKENGSPLSVCSASRRKAPSALDSSIVVDAPCGKEHIISGHHCFIICRHGTA